MKQPVDQVKSAKKGNAFLILTHNHQLDFELCQAILKRDDALWMGVIGSETKAKRFQYRLTQRGFSEQQIEANDLPCWFKRSHRKITDGSCYCHFRTTY